MDKRKAQPEGNKPAEEHHQPNIHKVSFRDLRPSRNVPTAIPTIAATIRPNRYGNELAISATTPADNADAIAGRFFSTGTTMAMKVSGKAKSSDHESGIAAPRKIPKAVLTCQVDQSARPAPNKNQWLKG